jgi:superfamily II DNA or RNA helicase
LVTQLSGKLAFYEIDHGVFMAGSWRFNAKKPCQVASVQTLESRGWDYTADILLYDEAHILRKSFIEFVEKNPDVVVIGFTATPFHKEIGKVYQAVVNPTTVNKQIEEGFLTPLRIFQCVAADMTGAKITAGEWAENEVKTRGQKIIGDIVTTWQEKTTEIFGGPVKTIVFSANIAHGQEIVDAFAASGFNFKLLTGKDDSEEKDAIIEEFRKENQQYDGLVSCGVLTRGFDVTDIQCGIDARPLRKSFSEFIQKIGRTQRCHTWSDGRKKDFGLWLDHANNVGRFLPEMLELWENGVSSLADPPDAKPPRKEPTPKEKDKIFCPKCHQLWTVKGDTCPCGYKRPKKQSTMETVAGTMREVVLNHVKLANSRRELWEQIVTYVQYHGKPETAEQRAYHNYRDMTGSKPPREWQDEFYTIPFVTISRAVKNEFTRKAIAYHKSRQ